MNRLHPFSLLIVLAMVPLVLGCPPAGEPGEPRRPADTALVGGEEPEAPSPFQTAETLAKRAVLYRAALQEGDLAPFTFLPQALEGAQIPPIARTINSGWWDFPHETAHIDPLPSTTITALEPDAFRLIAARLDESDEEQGWCQFTLGYDPNVIRRVIADAHEEWIPEQRDWFMAGTEPGCLQVWCANIKGEWKIVAQLSCPDRIDAPTPPPAPARVPTSPPEPEESASDTEGDSGAEGE